MIDVEIDVDLARRLVPDEEIDRLLDEQAAKTEMQVAAGVTGLTADLYIIAMSASGEREDYDLPDITVDAYRQARFREAGQILMSSGCLPVLVLARMESWRLNVDPESAEGRALLAGRHINLNATDRPDRIEGVQVTALTLDGRAAVISWDTVRDAHNRMRLTNRRSLYRHEVAGNPENRVKSDLLQCVFDGSLQFARQLTQAVGEALTKGKIPPCFTPTYPGSEYVQ